MQVGDLVKWNQWHSDGFGILLEQGSENKGKVGAWRVQWLCGPYLHEKGWVWEIDLEVINESR